MGLAQEREDLKDRQYDWDQRWLHDMHWLCGSDKPCPCSDCKWKRNTMDESYVNRICDRLNICD